MYDYIEMVITIPFGERDFFYLGLQVRTQTMNFLWIEDFPLFSPKEDGEGMESSHHPFTSPVEEDLEKIYSDPENVSNTL